jgi:ABC-type Fe3+ transport system permease subunit
MTNRKHGLLEVAKLFGISAFALAFGYALGTARANASPSAARPFTCLTASSTIVAFSVVVALVVPLLGALVLRGASHRSRRAVPIGTFIIVAIPGIFVYHLANSGHCTPWP